MQISREDRVRMERAHVRAWPALKTADVGGWLWRCSGGGSQRANSVSTLDFNGIVPEGAIAEVEARYQAAGQPARFHTFDETSPVGLDRLLLRRGYRHAEPTITMFKQTEDVAAPPDVELRQQPWTEWRDVYQGAISADRRAVNMLILDRVPSMAAFFGFRRGGEVIATALCVVSFGCAVIECVATRSDARRLGAAGSLMCALEHWAAHQSADWLGLQVVAGNVPAVTLYQRRGFVAGATNSFWIK